jgi:beta-galactosidase
MKRSLAILLLCLIAALLPALEWDFRNGDLHGFRTLNFEQCEMVPGEGFHGTSHQAAYFMTPEGFLLNAADYAFIAVEFEGDATDFPIYFSHPGIAMSEKTRIDCSEKQNGMLLYDLGQCPEWRGAIDCLRFDMVLQAAGPEGTMRAIRLLKEKPTSLDGVQIPDGNFLQSGRGWSGDASYEYLQACIPAGGTAIAPKTEITLTGAYLLDWEADGPLQAELVYKDILGQEIGRDTAGPQDHTRLLPPRLAAYAQIKFRNPGDSTVTLKRASLLPIAFELDAESAHRNFLAGYGKGFGQGLVRQLLGYWLWNAELGEKPHTQCVFEKAFDLENADDLKSAIFYFTADNEVEALVNGTRLETVNQDVWVKADAVDVKSLLHNGRNTLRLKVYNVDGPGGAIADLVLIYADGSKKRVVTDNSWRCQPLSGSQINAWARIPATQEVQVLGVNGTPPWQLIIPNGTNLLKVSLEGLDLPATPTESPWAPANARLVPRGECVQTDDADFTIRLSDGTHDYLLLNTLIPAGTLDNGTEFPLTLAPATLSLLPPGSYKATATLGGHPLPFAGNDTITVKPTPENSPEHALPFVSLINQETVPRLEINGSEHTSMIQYLIDMNDEDNNYREIKLAADSDVPGLWLHYYIPVDAQGKIDFTTLDNVCTSALLRNPELHLVVIAGLDPMRSPTLLPLLEAQPESLVVTADGSHKVINYGTEAQTSPSMASEIWLDLADDLLEQITEHLDKMPYGKRVVALLPSSGITWEWMYWGCQNPNEFVDYSVAFRQAFVRFAQGKYGTIQKANAAWKTAFHSFQEIVDTNALPRPEARRDHNTNAFLRLPAQSQMVMDFNRCMAEVVSDAIVHLCTTVKNATGGRLLTGAYYGYLNEITASYWSQNSGHWALRKILDSPVVDLLHAPSSYMSRGPGGPGAFMIPVASARQAKMVFTTEADIRTLHSGAGAVFGGCHTLGESAAVLAREMAACLAHGVALRYYDFSNGWTFRDLRLAQMAQRLSQAEETIAQAAPKLIDPANAMAIIVSQDAMERVTYNTLAHAYAISQQRVEIGHTGVAHENYVMPGLEQIPLEHRLWFFQNPLSLSDEEIAYLQEKILIPGNTVIFGMAIDPARNGDHFSTETMEKLTGMHFDIDLRGCQKPTPVLTAQGIESLGPNIVNIGCTSFQEIPVFRPATNSAILAVDGDGLPVMAESTVNSCRVIFSALPPLRASWLRALALQIGLHCYDNRDSDSIWAAGNVLGIHFAAGGERTLKVLETEGTAKELISGEEFPVHDGQFNYTAQPMSTAIFLVTPKEETL